MTRLVRENALCALAALAASAAMGWLGLYGFAWNDYEAEAKPAVDALVAGHLSEFLRLSPSYGGSLIERSPFALLPGLWGGGSLAVYRMLALPCLLAAAALAVWLCARMRNSGSSLAARALAVAICVANPLTLSALELGHPEELLGASLCVAAVLLAGEGRAVAAGVALGLAIANKEWALLATGPVLLALPTVRSGLAVRAALRCVGSAVVVGAAVLAPLALAGSGFAASAGATAVAHGTIFQPWQVWWFLGHHGALVHGQFGAPKPGYRIGPAWTGTISHPLVVVVGLSLALALWVARSRRGVAEQSRSGYASGATPRSRARGPREALQLLALVMLARCALDTWDTSYYALPLVLSLLAWETEGAGDRPPVLALAVTVVAWVDYEWLPLHASADVQAAVFLLWTVPLAVWLSARLFARGPADSQSQSTVVSSLARPVRTRRPSAVMTARSSIRTPHSPGR